MSKSAAGKIGGEKSKLFSAQRKQQNIEKYFTSPKHCNQCNSILDYKDRYKVFCNSSCSASFNNKKRTKNDEKKCLQCLCLIGTKKKYCSITCQQKYQSVNRLNDWLLNNVKPGYAIIKRYLTEKYGYKCLACGIENYNNKPITLEIEHKDGNSDNNNVDNLCFLCPNCHSQTDTYKGKNKGNGRHSRRLRYQQNKSY